jgi:hypothetical protein
MIQGIFLDSNFRTPLSLGLFVKPSLQSICQCLHIWDTNKFGIGMQFMKMANIGIISLIRLNNLRPCGSLFAKGKVPYLH